MSSGPATRSGLASHSPPPARLLDVEGLSVSFRSRGRELTVVHDVDLRVGRAEVVGLVGESGSGKSVTGRAIAGLHDPGRTVVKARRMQLGDLDLQAVSERDFRRIRGREIGVVVQDSLGGLNPVRTVGSQLVESIRVHSAVSRSSARAQAIDALGEVGLPRPSQCFDEYPHRLSGGMRQRVLLTMSIVQNPRLLIADEPTTALDPTVQAGILALLDRLRREREMSVVLITHDMGVVAELCDRVSVMYDGRVIESGDTLSVLTSPLHPYSAGLIRATPKPFARREELRPIPGAPPSAGARSLGCSFAPRCDHRRDVCSSVEPEVTEPEARRTVRCFFPLEASAPESGHGDVS